MSRKKKPAIFGAKIVEIYQQTISLLSENPTILFLFLMIALMDALALTVLYFAPSKPFSILLAPIIRAFWSEAFLHYPKNFILLPKLFNHAHFVILTFVGIVITGIVVKKIEAHLQGGRVTTVSAAGPVMKRYFSLLVAWLLTYFSFWIAIKLIMPILPRSLPVQLTAGFGIALILQSLFVFLIPAIMIQGRGLLPDLVQGLLFGLINLPKTALLIAVPVVLVIGVSYFKSMAPVFVESYPEAVLWILGVSIGITMMVDMLITSATTILYVKARNQI